MVAQGDQAEHVDARLLRLGSPAGGADGVMIPVTAVTKSDRLRLLVTEQLLDAADSISFLVQKAVDPSREVDVGGPIVAAVAGTLHRL